LSVSVRPARSIWIGFDPRESAAFAVCRESISKYLTLRIPVRALVLDDLRAQGLYTRPTSKRLGKLWDDISDAPMSTEFACSRFLVPHIAHTGWALFMDCDMMARSNLIRLFELAEHNPEKAVLCVKHKYEPAETEKMDGQVQTKYRRKNWSSFCLFNCDHPANRSLTPDFVNTATGRDMHQFCWLNDNDILGIDEAYNWIPGHSPPDVVPKVVHWSEGGPWFTGFEDVQYANEWRQHLHAWAA
jgi:hypothetical protein